MLRKKITALISILISLCSTAFCSDFFFQLSLCAVKGSCEVHEIEKFYLPENINFLIDRNVIDNGKIIPFLEKLFPEEKGVLEGSGFYIAENDTGEWVEQVLLQIEEEKIAESLSELEDNNKSSLMSPEEDYENLVEKNCLNSNSELFYQEFGSEIFIPKKLSDGKSVVTIVNNDEIKRFFYDQLYRIEKKEFWTNKISPVTRIKTEEYEYDEDSLKPLTLTVSDNAYRKRYYYQEDGIPYELKIYELKDKKYILQSKTRYVYDDEKRLLKEEQINYTYSNMKITDTFVKKHIFKYNFEGIPADEDYYEDDVLKMSTKHSDVKGTYTQHIFFDDKFSVKIFYEDDIKIKEEFNTDGKKRVKEYEKR